MARIRAPQDQEGTLFQAFWGGTGWRNRCMAVFARYASDCATDVLQNSMRQARGMLAVFVLTVMARD
ncbi:MAG TPA: hypothetical protein DC058_24615 [Planctomycetaceae bacterium]|jgi:hypothetical protein|nr:hypothetical protein [Planctomycetaceae bacterium]